MSFAYHSSGEIDENGVYEKPSEWDDNFNELIKKEFGFHDEKIKKVISLPKEFTREYYDEKISKYDKSSPDYWEWVRLKQYAMAVLKMLEQVSIVYKKIFNLDDNVFEDFINLSAQTVDLKSLSQQLSEAEISLNRQFDKTSRSLYAKFNKHSTLLRVKNYGAKSWMMLYALIKKVPIKSMLSFTNAYQNYDLKYDDDILKTYRAYTLLTRSIALYVKPNMLPNYFYNDVDVFSLFDQVCAQVGAFDRADLTNLMKNINEDLKRLKSDERYSDLIDFYSSYDDIQKTFYDVKKISTDYYTGQSNRDFNIFWDMSDNGNDIFLKAKNYLNLIKKIKNCHKFKGVFETDLKAIEKIGQQAIDFSNTAYSQTHTPNLD